MLSSRITTFKLARNKQSGAVLMIMMVVMVMGAAAVLVSTLNSSTVQIARYQKTSDVLAQAKDALIGYAVSRGDIAGTPRPGDLPCPDTDAPGTAGYGDAEGSCSVASKTTIGRLPWKTLGIPELLDDAGEPLWYAISGNFLAANNNANPINSDTSGTLNVYDNNGTALLPTGSNTVAIVFSAGNPIAGQSRSTSSTLCTTTNTNIAKNKCAMNYLDAANGRNNWKVDGPFIAGNKSNTFNDRLLFITADQLLPPVEKRVASELKSHLNSYYASWKAYPFAATFANPSAISTTYTGVSALTYGLYPFGGINGIGTQPTLPTWNAPPTIAFSGGSILGTMSCILNTGAATNSRWRCCDVSGGVCTGNNITIPAGVTVTITGKLNNVGLGFWKLHDITDNNVVRFKDSSGNTVSNNGTFIDGLSVTGNLNFTNGSATVIFSATGKSGGSTLQRIELRDILYQSSPLPSWFQVNKWNEVMYYTASPGYEPGNNSCNPLPGTPSCLTVNGNGGGNNKRAAIIMTGCAISGSHPSGALNKYLEDENATPADFIYENKTRSTTFNDQVIIVSP